MAKLVGVPGYTGTIGELSAYRMQGVDKIILRKKGGPTKQQIKKKASFAITRQLNEEFTGRMLMVKQLNQAMQEIRHLYHGNDAGRLGAVCKKIQEADINSFLGKRSVLLSAAGYWLEGFSLNRYHPFDAIVKHPLAVSINKLTGTATISWPVLLPGLHLLNPLQQPFYRFVFVLSTVADMVYDEQQRRYHPTPTASLGRAVAQTDWHIAGKDCAAQTFTLQIPQYTAAAGLSLLLSGGIEYGQPQTEGYIKYTKYAGAGKLLKLA